MNSQQIFNNAPAPIPLAQREPVSCRCGNLSFVILAAVFTDKLDVSRREIDPAAFLQCGSCRIIFPINAPAKSKARVDGESSQEDRFGTR